MTDNKIAKERITMYKLFESTCEKYSKWAELPAIKQQEIIRRMERSCFANIMQEAINNNILRSFNNIVFTSLYSAKCFNILNNLNNDIVADTYLLDNLINGNIDPYKIGDMTSAELSPDANLSERNAISARRNQEIKYKVSNSYKCYKCGKKETVLLESQTRGTDEDSTWSIRCIHCNTVWRK